MGKFIKDKTRQQILRSILLLFDVMQKKKSKPNKTFYLTDVKNYLSFGHFVNETLSLIASFQLVNFFFDGKLSVLFCF